MEKKTKTAKSEGEGKRQLSLEDLRMGLPTATRLRGIKIGKRIGKGSYGYIYEGTAEPMTRVAVKVGEVGARECKTLTMLSSEYPDHFVEFYGTVSTQDLGKLCHHGLPANTPESTAFVFELLDINLYQWRHTDYHRLKETSQPLKDIARQLVTALKCLGEQNLVHCDIKPENIMLVDGKARKPWVKLIDFGSMDRRGLLVTHLFQSAFYRAPEVVAAGTMTKSKKCGKEKLQRTVALMPALDMWSLGCTLHELSTAEPLFPVYTTEELREAHEEKRAADWQKTNARVCVAVDSDGEVLVKLQTIIPPIHPREHLLAEMLDMNPLTRISPTAALRHPYLA